MQDTTSLERLHALHEDELPHAGVEECGAVTQLKGANHCSCSAGIRAQQYHRLRLVATAVLQAQPVDQLQAMQIGLQPIQPCSSSACHTCSRSDASAAWARRDACMWAGGGAAAAQAQRSCAGMISPVLCCAQVQQGTDSYIVLMISKHMLKSCCACLHQRAS